MDKEALLNIIISDISEIELLVKSFQGKQDIPKAFMELTERKLTHLVDEFSLLKTLTTDAPQHVSKTEEPVAKVEVVENTIECSTQDDHNETKEIVTTIPEPIESSTENIIEEHVKKQVQPKKNDLVEKENKISETITEPEQSTNHTEKVKIEDNTITLGESFVGEKKSVNDRITSTLETKIKNPLMGKPVSDLTKELGINDRFMFQRELFDDKNDVMQQTLQQLNEMPDLNSAQSFIASNFNWDDEREVTQSFYNYIKRKY